MTDQEKNAFGCMGILAVGAFIWLSAAVIGGVYEQAVHPERVEQRREAERVELRRREAVAASEAAATAVRHAERKQRDDDLRAKENACIRQLGYDECRRIYRPTSEEMAAQLALAERASRLAEAHAR